jgi:uncharacterized protein (UPF0335 family)
MSEEGLELGGNAAKDFNDRLDAYSAALDAVEAAKAEVKRIKDDAKGEGYDMKAFAEVEKCRRKGAKHTAAQFTLELVRTTYLKAAGLPHTLALAQKAAEAEAEDTPAPKAEKKAKGRKSKMN